MTRVSHLADGLRSSAILKIAGEVRALVAEGRQILNLTVGDFSSKQFRIPRELEDGIVDALRAGESTYPPPNRPREPAHALFEISISAALGLDFPRAVHSHCVGRAAGDLRALSRRRRSGRTRGLRRAVVEQQLLLPDARRDCRS